MEEEKSGIFFAGEHTNRYYPASVHGAYLSGLRLKNKFNFFSNLQLFKKFFKAFFSKKFFREAGRIADKYLPTPYRTNNPEDDDT